MAKRVLRTVLIIVPIALLILAAGAFALYERTKLREEQELYAELLSPQPKYISQMWENVAYLSTPVICGAPPEPAQSPDFQELYGSYVEANSDNSPPVSMEGLEGRVPVVSWDSVQRINRAGGIRLVTADSRRLVGVSRVGFSKALSEALLCVHGEGFPHSNGYLIRYVRSGEKWEFAEKWYSNTIN